MTTIGATKVVPLRMKPGDRERINRTRRVLEQDIVLCHDAPEICYGRFQNDEGPTL